MRKLRLLSMGLILMAAAACTEEIKVEPYTWSQIITGETHKSWSIRSIQFFVDGKAPTLLGLSACALDDVYTFYNNSERLMSVTEGATKCVPGDPDLIGQSTWSFVNTTATFTFFSPVLASGPLPFTLTQIDETKFTVEIYRDDTSGFRLNFKSVATE